jgi:hypothetical protein
MSTEPLTPPPTANTIAQLNLTIKQLDILKNLWGSMEYNKYNTHQHLMNDILSPLKKMNDPIEHLIKNVRRNGPEPLSQDGDDVQSQGGRSKKHSRRHKKKRGKRTRANRSNH